MRDTSLRRHVGPVGHGSDSGGSRKPSQHMLIRAHSGGTAPIIGTIDNDVAVTTVEKGTPAHREGPDNSNC